MTVNLSENQKTRIFSADAPPEIAYERLPEVENQIKECLRLNEAGLAARLATGNNRQSEGFLREETLCCLLFLAHRENLEPIERQAIERLFIRCERRVRKILELRNYDKIFIETATADLQILMLEQIVARREKSYDFWEARFYKTLTTLIGGYLHKHGKKRQATDLFAEMLPDAAADEEAEADFESNLKSLETLTADERVDLQEVLRKLPDENRKIFIFYYGYEWTQEEIARALGMTARTVRNRLKQIAEFVSPWREGGER